MASKIIVNEISAPTTGVNANKIVVPTGQKIVATDSAAIVAPGMTLQTVTHSWDTYNSPGAQLSVQTYAWTLYPQSEIQLTAKGANSLFLVHYQCPVASRSASAASTDIFGKVNSGSFTALKVTANSGSNGYYGLGTLWGTNSSDDWNTPSLFSANVVGNSVGDTIYFQMALRSGGPGSDNLNGTHMAGHPHFTGIAVVQEIAQ